MVKPPWKKHAVLNKSLDSEVASLGREIGLIDVRCNLVKTDSKWHTPDGPIQEPPPHYPLSGLLYFEFQIREKGMARLISATINVTLKDAEGNFNEEKKFVEEGILVKAMYPGPNALKPDRTLMRQVADTRDFQVDPQVSTPYGSAKGVKCSKKAESKSEVEQTWSFNSGRPSGSSNQAEFFWRRNTPHDWTATERGFDGALTLCRKHHKDIIVEVLVKIWDKHNFNFGLCKSVKETVGRKHGTSFCEKSVFDSWAANLPQEILDRNVQRENPRLQTTTPASSRISEPGSEGTSRSES